MTKEAPYKNRTVFLFIAVLCFIIYGNSLSNGYNLDDAWAFEAKGNDDLITGLKESFTTTLVNIGDVSYGFRPVTTAAFIIEKAVFGQDPEKSHLINIVLYIFVCYAFFIWLSKYIRTGWWLAISITLIYLLLPIHSEVVNSVKNRDELLSALFGLLFLIQCWKYYQTGNKLSIFWIVLFFILSLLSKKNSIPLLAVVPIGLWILDSLNKKRLLILSLLPFLTYALTWMSIGAFIDLGETSASHEVVENPLYGEHTGKDRLMASTNSLGFYITGIGSFHEFGAYFGLKTIDFLKFHVSYMVAVILFVFTGIFFLIMFLRKRVLKLPFFGLVFFTGCIFPFLNLLQKMPGVVGERLAFLASMGMSIFLGWLVFMAVQKLKEKSPVAKFVLYGALAGVTIFWSTKTLIRNTEWKDLETLMAADLEKYPYSVKMNMIMGSVQYNKGVKSNNGRRNVVSKEQVELAKEYFNKALVVEKNHVIAIYNSAWIDTYILDGDPEEVEADWWKLVELKALDSNAVMQHIALLKMRSGNAGDAINESLRLCQEGNNKMGVNGMRLALIDSDWELFWDFSECAYPETGLRQSKLTEIWKRLRTSEPMKAEALINDWIQRDQFPYYGKIKTQQLMMDGKLQEALSLLINIDHRFPNDLEIKLLFGNLYTSFDQPDNALIAFKQALALDPNNEGLKKHIESLENN